MTEPSVQHAPDAARPEGRPGGRSRSVRARRALLAGAGVALAALLAGILLSTTRGGGAGGSSPVADVSGQSMPGVSPATASLLSLSPDTHSNRVAPDFRLTDQHGRPVSLGQFRGKAVVLSFNDDRCTDVCTLLAEDVARADRYLKAAGRSHVVFLSVNVNPFYPQVRDVAQWTDDNELAGLPNWYFGTGPAATLRAIWKNYGVYVGTDAGTRTVTHDAFMEFINPSGVVRAVADFGLDAVDVAPYSHGMAQVAIDLLPPSERTPVAGPQASAGGGVGAGLGQQAPAFRLAELGGHGPSIDLAARRGTPVVLNFWASSCVDCRDELKAFADVAREDPKVDFVGVDVADPSPASAAAVANGAGARYPMAVDPGGRVAREYGVAALPTTVYVDPGGKITVVHPGAMTAEQLRYTLAEFFPGATPRGG